MQKLKEQKIFYDTDHDGKDYCYMWLEKFHPILKRTITYRVDFDVDDVDFIKSRRWFIHDWGYAFFPLQIGGVTVKSIYMHRQVAQHLLEDEQILDEVDHIDWNKLNNRRNNLRVVDRKTNVANKPPKSIYGRHYIQTIHSNLHHAYAPNDDKEAPAILLGGFATREEAIRAQRLYDEKKNSGKLL